MSEILVAAVNASFSHTNIAVRSISLYNDIDFSFSDNYNKVNSSSKFSLKLAFLKNPKVYSDASYSFSTKNGNLSSQNMQFSISSTFIIKNVKISGSLGWKVDL